MSEFFGVDLTQDHAAEAQSGHSVGTRQVRKKGLCLNECMRKSRKCHFLNRSRSLTLRSDYWVWSAPVTMVFPPAVPSDFTLLVACAPRSAPVDCAAYNRPHRVVPTRLGLHVNSIRRSFRPDRASVPPAGQAFSRKTRDAGSPHGPKLSPFNIEPRRRE